jgi:hypothetical protein
VEANGQLNYALHMMPMRVLVATQIQGLHGDLRTPRATLRSDEVSPGDISNVVFRQFVTSAGVKAA